VFTFALPLNSPSDQLETPIRIRCLPTLIQFSGTDFSPPPPPTFNNSLSLSFLDTEQKVFQCVQIVARRCRWTSIWQGAENISAHDRLRRHEDRLRRPKEDRLWPVFPEQRIASLYGLQTRATHCRRILWLHQRCRPILFICGCYFGCCGALLICVDLTLRVEV